MEKNSTRNFQQVKKKKKKNPMHFSKLTWNAVSSGDLYMQNTVRKYLRALQGIPDSILQEIHYLFGVTVILTSLCFYVVCNNNYYYYYATFILFISLENTVDNLWQCHPMSHVKLLTKMCLRGCYSNKGVTATCDLHNKAHFHNSGSWISQFIPLISRMRILVLCLLLFCICKWSDHKHRGAVLGK